ncbi:OmpA family protein [Massilia antarctica]|uniref:OmpA family protein n=1 Tax=Massilia antarctica TaxID=2765360 RepID=UPI0006BB834E|nr:OmpA family protein [Massilia sp. H27-R4]MCY0911574.1 OmpA family protein [Massilia sp. H27-R4]CUI04808.1 Outer membrane protein A precursor [Janthinobacterium sp. CG23_2]CUU28594.1 Outer membrane protein A precursor [Janthinobacterium sp. CG23_2]
MTLTKKIGTLSAIGFAMLAGQASAQEQFVNPEWANHATYIGAGIGQSRSYTKAAPVIRDLNALGGHVNSWNADEKDMGYKLFVGKQLNRYFAIEAGFFDLGNFNIKAGTCCGVLNAEQKYKGVNLDLIAQLPMGERFSVYGRAGMHYTKAKTQFSGTRATGMFAGEHSEKKLNPKVGVGLEYKFTEALALRAEAENYRVDDALRNNGNVRLYSMNLVYKLGRPAAAAPMPAPAPAPMPEATPAPAPAPMPAPAPAPVPVSEKVSFAAEALFDFDKSVVKPEGKAALDDLLNKLQGMNTEVMVTVGHTDSVGSDAYNQKLSLRRAEAVKAYIVSKGVEASRVYTEGKGESQPVADNKTAEGRAKNRRVTVEVVGTRTTTK